MNGPSVVIVETDWQVREKLRRVFEHRGYSAWTCPNPDLAISIFATILPDLVVIDLEESNTDAQVIAIACREVSPMTRVVFRPTKKRAA